MEIETITFNTAEDKLGLTYTDGTSRFYGPADAEQYLADHPDREADIVAMGWA